MKRRTKSFLILLMATVVAGCLANPGLHSASARPPAKGPAGAPVRASSSAWTLEGSQILGAYAAAGFTSPGGYYQVTLTNPHYSSMAYDVDENATTMTLSLTPTIADPARPGFGTYSVNVFPPGDWGSLTEPYQWYMPSQAAVNASWQHTWTLPAAGEWHVTLGVEGAEFQSYWNLTLLESGNGTLPRALNITSPSPD